MDLFTNEAEKDRNLLPEGGTVNYYGWLMSGQQADHYFEALLQHIEWKNDEAIIFGKHIMTKRKVAWYGDREFEYTYSDRKSVV